MRLARTLFIFTAATVLVTGLWLITNGGPDDIRKDISDREARKERPPRPDPEMPDDLPADLNAPTFRVIPLHETVREVGRRFDGKVIAVMLVGPSRDEKQKGVQLVYAVRLLTPTRDVLDLRVDAEDGKVIDIRGNDIAAARKKK